VRWARWFYPAFPSNATRIVQLRTVANFCGMGYELDQKCLWIDHMTVDLEVIAGDTPVFAARVGP
jgi:hypothetical protein